MKKKKTPRRRQKRVSPRSAKLSVAEIEKCQIHLDILVCGLDRLGSAQFKSQREEFLALLDFMQWSRVFRRLAEVRDILHDSHERAVGSKRIDAFYDRIDPKTEWRFNAAAERRMKVLARTWRK